MNREQRQKVIEMVNLVESLVGLKTVESEHKHVYLKMVHQLVEVQQKSGQTYNSVQDRLLHEQLLQDVNSLSQG